MCVYIYTYTVLPIAAESVCKTLALTRQRVLQGGEDP